MKVTYLTKDMVSNMGAIGKKVLMNTLNKRVMGLFNNKGYLRNKGTYDALVEIEYSIYDKSLEETFDDVLCDIGEGLKGPKADAYTEFLRMLEKAYQIDK